MVCATALTVVNTIENEKLGDRATHLASLIASGIEKKLSHCKEFNHVRHMGLMLGIELNTPCPELVGKALDNGLLINVTAERVIRLLPPLTMSDSEAEEIVERVSQLVLAWAEGL